MGLVDMITSSNVDTNRYLITLISLFVLSHIINYHQMATGSKESETERGEVKDS